MIRNLAHRNSGVAKLVRSLAKSDISIQQTHTDTGEIERARWAVLLLKGNVQTFDESSIVKLAPVVHHGGSVRQIRCASSIVRRNYRSGSTSTHNLLHQMTDRICVMKYGKQKFGTQLHVVSGFDLLPLPSKASDVTNKAVGFYHCDRCASSRHHGTKA
jgi:hypothetical protein